MVVLLVFLAASRRIVSRLSRFEAALIVDRARQSQSREQAACVASLGGLRTERERRLSRAAGLIDGGEPAHRPPPLLGAAPPPLPPHPRPPPPFPAPAPAPP